MHFAAVGRSIPNPFLLYALSLSMWLGLAGCGWETSDRLIQAQQETQDDSKPAASKTKTNRLARETSPYLLLHAHNPVDWYPWGPEAFETARRENKPIFLSIGYSACYWCHVMERLSFSNPEIAKYMNENFVNIKVDREERPDIDDIYMTACVVYFQAIGSPQGGGWPLSMFLTPDGEPFAGGTYFPPDDQQGRMGFQSVLKQVKNAWSTQPDGVRANAALLTREVQRAMKPRMTLEAVKLERALVSEAVERLKSSYDDQFGGVDFNPQAPDRAKFPVPAKLELLQYQATRHGDEQAAKQLYHTLDQLALGGIHDHLGGGFHRYSTDREWHVPHFEKMLYDQAQLASVFADAYRKTNKQLYRQAVEGICDFVLREMREPSIAGRPGGGFHSALDAETEHIEGLYYVWTPDEVLSVLGEADGKLFVELYGLDQPQTFEHGYVLRLKQDLTAEAAARKTDPLEFQRRVAALRAKLLSKRNGRVRPLKDDKILTSWNGLMIGALARAGRSLGRTDYVEASATAADFVLANMRDDQGRLHRTYRSGTAKLNAYLDDYAFLVQGLLELHRATRDAKWLKAAQTLTDDQLKMFWDEKNHAFYFTPHHHEQLIARTRNAYDSVLPAGNSISVRNLIRLASLTSEPAYRERAQETLAVFAPVLESNPRSATQLGLALDEYLDDPDFRTGLIEAVPRQPPRSRVVSAAAETDSIPELRQVESTSYQEQNQNKEKVTAKAYLSVDRLPPGGRCRIAVIINIADGWHINTNPAQPDFLVPTEINASCKLKTAIGGWTFPAGKKLMVDGFDEEFMVFEKRVIVFGQVQVPTAAAGQNEELTLQINYQACNDARCLKPSKITIRGLIPVAQPGQPSRPINVQLFKLAPQPASNR